MAVRQLSYSRLIDEGPAESPPSTSFFVYASSPIYNVSPNRYAQALEKRASRHEEVPAQMETKKYLRPFENICDCRNIWTEEDGGCNQHGDNGVTEGLIQAQ